MNSEYMRRRLSSEEINALPLWEYEGPVEVIRSSEDWERVLPDLRAEQVLGFDTETRPTFRKGRLNSPALIQLSTASRVYLIKLGDVAFGPRQAALLADPSVVKVGVGIRDDMRELAKLSAFEPAGLMDLGAVARIHKMPCQGLRTLTALLLERRISKGSQCSNWSIPELSARQIIYAATDAWIGRLLFVRMCELGLIPAAAGSAVPAGVAEAAGLEKT